MEKKNYKLLKLLLRTAEREMFQVRIQTSQFRVERLFLLV